MEKTKNQIKENVDVQQTIEEIRTDAFLKVITDHDQRRIVNMTLELLANGCPVLPDEIALPLGIPPEKVLSTLQGFGAEFDNEGNVVGFGLTLVATPHSYEVRGRKMYTWCAVDALLFPVMLRHTAEIESRDPVTGKKIRVTVSTDGVQKVEPKSAVVSWVDDIDLSNIRGSVCHYVHFFASPESASRWIAENPGKKFYPLNNDVYSVAIQLQKRESCVQEEKCR